MNKITFRAPYPVSVNRLWMPVRGRMVLTDEARAYKQHLGHIAGEYAGQGVFFPNDQLLSLELILYRPSKRGDTGNFEKIVSDSMNKILFVDDEQFIEIHLFRRDKPEDPHVLITIEHIEDREPKKRKTKTERMAI